MYCHLLVGFTLQIEPQGVRLELGKAAAQGENETLELLGRDHADRRIVHARPREGIPEGALAVRLLARRGVAEGDVGVQGGVLEAGGGLDGRDDLAGDAQLREAAERRLLVGTEVA